MKTLYERAKADNRRILNKKFSVKLLLTNPEGDSEEVQAFYIDTNLDINPETGMPVKSRKIALGVHTEDLAIGNPAEDEGTWKARFTNNVGDDIYGVLETPLADRTLGMITFIVKLLKVVS